MDQQDDTLDFQSLRAKFQDQELLLKPPKSKPALPEKPKVVPPPPLSPTHPLPAGARPSLLTSLSFEGRTLMAPRVVFKDEKKESKKPLIHAGSKPKARGYKERLEDDPSEAKKKKENGKAKESRAESAALLVPAATPPPKAPAQKKKGFLGFKKSLKGNSVEVAPEPILDAPSEDIPGPAPLIPGPAPLIPGPAPLIPSPAPLTSSPIPLTPAPLIPGPVPLVPSPAPLVSSPAPIVSSPAPLVSSPAPLVSSPAPIVPAPAPLTPLTPLIPAPLTPALSDPCPPAPLTPTLPDPAAPTETPRPPLVIAAPPDPNRSPDFILPDPTVPLPLPLLSETPAETSAPPPSVAPPGPVASTPSPVAPSPPPSPPPPLLEPELVAVEASVVEAPPVVAGAPPSTPPSPQSERSISALSALERAEDMAPPPKRLSADQRILNALEKARKKVNGPQTDVRSSSSVTPPPEELSPTFSLPELPPIDYVDKAGPKPAQVNGINHRPASPLLEVGEESDPGPDLPEAPSPAQTMVLPEPDSPDPAPEEPARPPYTDLTQFIPPPPLEENEVFSDTDLPEFDDVASAPGSPEPLASDWGNEDGTGPDALDGQNQADYYSNGVAGPEAQVSDVALEDNFQDEAPPVAGLVAAEAAANGIVADNAYEDVTVTTPKKKGKSDVGKKRKGPPKNPYMEAAQEHNEEKTKTSRFGKNEKKSSSEGPDEKELKKREKQQKEKEKKELKEKQEREKREQKQLNELKKKFNICGQEDAIYQATVTVTTKGRKNDLPVKSGDNVSIIRTTNCPKGKWLARDSSNNYGYVAVDHVELDIKEMMEMGKKAAITRNTSNTVVEPEVTSTGSKASNHYPLSTGSFTDDSEEWTGDEDDTASPVQEAADPLASAGHTRTLSMPDMGNKDLSVVHQHSHSDISAEGSHLQARHEALQKLATFFHSPKPAGPASSSQEAEKSRVLVKQEAVEQPDSSETPEADFDPDAIILPPPDLYADETTE